MHVKTGDEVQKGQPIARLYGEQNTTKAGELILEALEISDAPVERSPIIKAVSRGAEGETVLL